MCPVTLKTGSKTHWETDCENKAQRRSKYRLPSGRLFIRFAHLLHLEERFVSRSSRRFVHLGGLHILSLRSIHFEIGMRVFISLRLRVGGDIIGWIFPVCVRNLALV
jgi:hypothetical protein